MHFAFTPSPHFVKTGAEQASGDWSTSEKADIARVKSTYPELAGWGDLAIGRAWGQYSRAVWLVSWRHWQLDQHDGHFLFFCCEEQTRGAWPEGTTSALPAHPFAWYTH